MKNEKKHNGNFVLALTNDAIFAVLVGALGFVISNLLNLSDDIKSVIVGLSVLIGLTLINYLRRGVKFFSKDIGNRYMDEHTGIVEVYENLSDCKEDMQAEFEKATKIRLLLQIGRRELGDSESSYFYQLAMKKNLPETQIQILRASEESPFLSEERADFRKNSVERWREDLRRLSKEITILKNVHKVQIEEKKHKEPYLWRIFIFDDVAYVSAYLLPRENDQHTVVYKMRKGESSLYHIFTKYFDYLWEKYDNTHNFDEVEKWAKWI